MSHDPVNHPQHYTSHPSGVECIQVTEHMGFNLGNAVKYIWRADLKGAAIEDLEKAAWYVQREIEKRRSAASVQADPYGEAARAIYGDALIDGMKRMADAALRKTVAKFAPEVDPAALGDDPAARENYLRALAKSCIWAAMPAAAETVSSSLLRVQASERAEPEVREYLLAHFRELVEEVCGEVAARHDNESRN